MIIYVKVEVKESGTENKITGQLNCPEGNSSFCLNICKMRFKILCCLFAFYTPKI